MQVTRTFQFRLYPTIEQETLFLRFAGCRRFVWNYALARKRDHYQRTGKTLRYHALASELVDLVNSSI